MEQQPHQYPSSSTLAACGNDSAILEEKDGDDGDVGLNYLEVREVKGPVSKQWLMWFKDRLLLC